MARLGAERPRSTRRQDADRVEPVRRVRRSAAVPELLRRKLGSVRRVPGRHGLVTPGGRHGPACARCGTDFGRRRQRPANVGSGPRKRVPFVCNAHRARRVVGPSSSPLPRCPSVGTSDAWGPSELGGLAREPGWWLSRPSAQMCRVVRLRVSSARSARVELPTSTSQIPVCASGWGFSRRPAASARSDGFRSGDLLEVLHEVEHARVRDPSRSAYSDRSQSPIAHQLVDAAASQPERRGRLFGCQQEPRDAAGLGVG